MTGDSRHLSAEARFTCHINLIMTKSVCNAHKHRLFCMPGKVAQTGHSEGQDAREA